ncbi:MAG: DNA polymerase III subunit alpha [Polyangiales bacterium]
MSEGETESFVHLHVHSEFTMLDGAVRINELVKTCESLGMPAVALTDRANMYGAVQLHHACQGTNVKPILGAEVSVTSGDHKDERAPEAGHIVLLAESQEGYQNIVRLVSLGWVDGNKTGVPRIDFELLDQHREGVVALTACLGGWLPQQILMQGPEAGEKGLARLHEIYGESLYVELEDHGFPENRPLNTLLTQLADARNIPVVATNCTHFLTRDLAKSQLALQCIGRGRTLHEMEAMHHNSAEMYLKDAAAMAELFPDRPDALRNTLVIAERCAGKASPLSPPKLPRFPVPETQSEDDYLREVSQTGLEQRYDEMRKQGIEPNVEEYQARLKVELDVICSMGFPGYFLIVWDFIKWARDNDVPVGPGRGSGAGSLVAFSLRITNIDPLPYGLLFERFLNPERVSMPDFDIDFCMSKRDQVIEYVRNHYGRHSVGQIATFHQLKSKSVVRDMGRVMGLPPVDAGRIAALIPELGPGKSATIPEALKMEARLKTIYDNEPEIHELLDTAQQIENLTRHAGMHAAGVVISEGPIWDTVPVFCPEEDVIVTQYHKDDVEAAGLVKFDFLGLKTLTVLDIAVKLIQRRPDMPDEPFDLDGIPLDDPATYALLQSGETTNVFQLEGQGMQSLFKMLKPDCFEDIVAAVALYRPGPMGADMHTDFVHRKHGRQKVEFPDPCLEPILRDTRGVIVYQEQVMLIARVMGGYSLGGADILRRAMGKKKASEMEKQKKIFIEGAGKLGHTAEKAEEVFDLIAFFAGYGFNKSHSAAYALITYQTAYLKTHFPAEFCCATMSADKDKSDKVVRTVAESRALGITVMPPDVNQSAVDFTVVYDNAGHKERRHASRPVAANGECTDPTAPSIRFGLGALKGVGHSALDAIFEARQAGTGEKKSEEPFIDLFDFCDRVDLRRVNKNVCEALVQSGAFDRLHSGDEVHRAQAVAAVETAIERGKRSAQERASGQTNLFGLLGGSDDGEDDYQKVGGTFPSGISTWDSKELLQREKKTLGFYVSGHPLDRYTAELRRFCNATTESIATMEMERGFKVIIGGAVEGYRERRTRAGATMAFFEIEDSYGRVEVIVRPRQLENDERLRAVLSSGDPIILEASVKHEFRGQDADPDAAPEPKLILQRASSLEEVLAKKTKYINIKVDVSVLDHDKLVTLKTTLEKYSGPVPVSLQMSNSDERWTACIEETGVCVEPSDALLASLERLFGGKVAEMR